MESRVMFQLLTFMEKLTRDEANRAYETLKYNSEIDYIAENYDNGEKIQHYF